MNLALCGLLPLAAAGVACSSSQTQTAGSGLSLEPTIVVPQDLIADIKVFALQVYPASPDGGTPITCDATTGKLVGVGNTKGIATKDGGPDETVFSSAPTCGLGFMRCFTVTLPQSTPLMLSVTGYSDVAMKVPVGVGCAGFSTTTAAIASTNITLVPTEICGDGILEPPETCDPGTMTDEECTSCQTKIDLLSSGTGSSGSNTVTGNPGDKRDPSFLWPSNGNFLAFFSDNSTNSAASEQISMSIRDSSFDPTSAIGTVADGNSIFLPNTPNAFPPTAEMDSHQQPVAVQSGGDTYVVFAYETTASHAIVLRAMTTSALDAVQGSPCAVSDATGDPGDLTAPAVAVSSINGNDVFFIAWQDNSGNIYGRTYTPSGTGACSTTLGPQTLLSSGASNSHVSVAGISGSWVVTWQSDANIVVRPIGSNGTPTNVAVPLSVVGVTPTIAAIPGTSNYAVAFSSAPPGSSATIFAQRFKMGSFPVDSSPFQVSQSSNGNGEVTPFIAAGSAAGGSYVVTWVDEGGAGQEVRARLLAGTTGSLESPPATGYLHNAIDGTTGEFLVSDTAARTRVSPTVVVGGISSGYMAFGWADNTSGGTFGILGRRFPAPTQ
jgi:hypothetical protein